MCGDAGGALTTFDSFHFRNRPNSFYDGTSLFGFFLGEDLMQTPLGPLLEVLAADLAAGHLHLPITVTADWSNTHDIATDLLARRFGGRAVLRVS